MIDDVIIRDGRHLATVVASLRRQIYGNDNSAILSAVRSDLTDLELKVRSDYIAFDVALKQQRSNVARTRSTRSHFAPPDNPLYIEPPKETT